MNPPWPESHFNQLPWQWLNCPPPPVKRPHSLDDDDDDKQGDEFWAADPHSRFIGIPLGLFLMRETVEYYAWWAWELQVWRVWSMRSSHQGCHLFVWVLLWHNSSWNAIWVWAFLSRCTKAKERMARKIMTFTFGHSTLLQRKNKLDKDYLIRAKHNVIVIQEH